jgi:hypothetical protein
VCTALTLFSRGEAASAVLQRAFQRTFAALDRDLAPIEDGLAASPRRRPPVSVLASRILLTADHADATTASVVG